ncbi:MAG: hypothetical protein J5770_01465 [Bacteroidaceae bacterium]|nr:hypothetical protein [Bacteroidaceae bacterium]
MELAALAMYLILAVAVFTLTPLMYEVIRRIPVIKWCVFGESNNIDLWSNSGKFA